MVFGLKLGGKKPAEPPPRDPTPSKGASGPGPTGGKQALTVNEFVARTKRCREKGLEPTKPELIAYSRYLGIDPIADGDLMWIADEALSAPLPSEWTEHHDSADRVFYYNVQTHASSWTHPLEQLHRDTYKTIISFRSGDLSKDDQAAELERLRRLCEESEKEAHQELQAWTEHTDEQGQKFYYNHNRQCSVWTDPRPARCHSLYLQMKALRVLGKHCGQAGVANTRGPEPLLGGKGRDIDRERIERSLKFANSALAMSLGTPAEDTSAVSGDDGGGNKEHRKKKKRHKERSPSPEDDSGQGGLTGGGELLPLKKGPAGPGPLDLKKPALSAVSEVRSALGVGPSGNGLLPMGGPGPLGGGGGGNGGGMGGALGGGMGGALGGGMGGALGGGMGGGVGNRLPSPLGDGLSSAGRTKVRAGIKLEPLKV